MKLATFRHQNRERLGIVVNDEIVDVGAVDNRIPSTMIEILAAGRPALDALRAASQRAGARLALDSFALLAPVPRPSKYLAIGANYARHVAERPVREGERPPDNNQTWFNKQVSCIIGPKDPIHLPRVSSQLDFEAELGIVIGTRCRHVPAEKAFNMIAGYIVCNDVSVRDWQRLAPTATMGKSFDTHGPTGPWLTTADEIADPQALRVRTWIDDEQRQDGNTSEFIHRIPEMIAFLTTAFTLEPGDILSTGSPAGVGGAEKPPRYLKAGQRCRIEIEGLGVIDNPIIDEPASTQQP